MPLNTRIYKDIDFNFTQHPVTSDISKKVDVAAIVGSLRNLFHTNYYERPFRPDIGSNIRRYLFEPVDVITTFHIRQEIENVINNYEPRVTLKKVVVSANPDYHRYDATITFFIQNATQPITINIILERVR